MKKKIILLGLIVYAFSYLEIAAQVNLQTGAAEFNIPLYSYSDPNNRIGTGVSLVYTAGNGLKVSEIPSSIGAGWSLAFGGYIQRIQHGEPDDQKNNITYTYPTAISNATIETNFHNWVDNYFPNGCLYSEYSPSTSVDNGGAYSPMFQINNYKYKPNPKYLADLEQDVFAFNFNGKTGYFVIGKKDQNNVYPIRTLYDSNLKIEKVDGDLNNTNNIRTTISEFQITDEDGIKYIFRDADLDQVCIYNKVDWYDYYGVYGGPIPHSYSPSGNGGNYSYYTYLNSTPQYNVTSANTKNTFVKNKWYLSEIVNPMTGVKIQFIYETYDFDLQGNKISQKTVTDGKTTFSLMIEKLKGTAKRLKKIILSTKELVEFNYSASGRIDVPTDKILENISVKYNDEVKYKWEFEQGYFVKNEIKSLSYSFTTEDKVWARLCLLKLKKRGIGNLAEPPYSFSYFMGNESDLVYPRAVPPLFSFYQDAWGYYSVSRYGGFYNPSTQSSSWTNLPYEPFGGNLLPKAVYDNPIDNSLAIVKGIKGASLEARNGVLKTITNPLGGSLIFTYELNYFDVNSFTGSGGVRVSQTTSYDGLDHTKDIINEYKYIKADGSTSAWGYDNGYAYSRSTNMRVYKKCGNQKFPAVNIPEFAIGLTKTWAIGGFNLSTTLSYVSSYSIAQIKQIIINVIVSIIIDLITPAYTEYSVSEYNSESFLSHNPLPFQYSRVEVINKLSTDNNGKTVFEFTSPTESNPLFAIDIPSLSAPFSSKQRYAYWLYGLPRVITVSNKDGKLVKKTENFYEPFKYSLSGDPKFASQKWIPNKRTFDCPFSPTNGTSSNDIAYDIYYPICGRVELKYTKEHIYNLNNPQEFAVNQTDFEYSSNNYLPKKIKSGNSKGEVVETNTYYPQDYTLSGVIQTMKNNNIINVPVSSQTLITKGSQKYLLSGNVSEFGALSNGDIKVIKTHSFRSTDPIISTTVPFNAAQLIPNTTYYKESGSINYNSTGNASQVNSDNGKIATIYDYENKLAIASAINADYTDIAYTSFEADGKGSWEFVDAGNIIITYSPTGKKCFYFPTGGSSAVKITRVINNPKTYTLSFWSKSDVPFIYKDSGPAILEPNKSFQNTATGWTYYEYSFTGPGTLTLSNRPPYHGISRSGYIDELRLYPSTSRISTTTYDAQVGKTSECDDNGRITYYEYDDLGRFKIIRDGQRNVIKTYEYNYKQ